MSVVAFVIERRLLKAIKQGAIKAASRTAAGSEGDDEEPPILPREWKVSTSSKQVTNQATG